MSNQSVTSSVKWGPAQAHSIPADIINLLKKQARAPDEEKEIHLAYLKLFTPDANCRWWVSEWHEEGDDVHLFGFADLGLGQGCAELGYTSLRELMTIRGGLGLPMERDLYYDPMLLSEVVAKNGR